MMKIIQTNYNGLLIDIKLFKHITFLLGNSGTGKTFLFSVLIGYFMSNSITYGFLDFNTNPDNALDVIKAYNNVEFILLDNADLYMTKELWEYINSAKNYFIISMKGCSSIAFNNVSICNISYTPSTLTLEPLI